MNASLVALLSNPVSSIVSFFRKANYESLAFSSLLLCAGLIFPWIVLIFMAILTRGMLNDRFGKKILDLVLIGFLAAFNATKQIEGDWRSYVAGYLEMLHIGFVDYLQNDVFLVRSSEPVFYAFEFLLTRLTDGNVFVFAVAVSLVIYLTYTLALEKLLASYGLRQLPAAVCIVFALLAGVTFTQSLNLVRQYIAGAMLFFYFIMLLEGRFKVALLLFVIGLLVHNSSLFPASLLAFSVYIWNSQFVRRWYVLVVVSLLILGFGAGTFISNFVLNSPLAITATKDDGGISMVVLAQDGLFFMISFLGVVLFGRSKGFYTRGSAVTVVFLAMSLGMLIGMFDLTLWILRFYFYIEWFRVVGVITIVWFLVYRLKSPRLVLLIIPLSFLILALRVESSPFNYGGGMIAHLLGSVVWWVNNLSEVVY